MARGIKKKNMDTIIQAPVAKKTMRQKMYDILVAISWADLSRTYFGKSNSWLYHKMDGRDGNGKPTSFSPEETQQLKGALIDLSNRIRTAAESL